MDTDSTLNDHVLLGHLKTHLEERSKLVQHQSVMLKELEELNEKLQNAEKMKSGFLSNIRNEINNPLTSILGLSGNMMKGHASQEQMKQWATLVNREAFNLDFLLRNIFSAAEIEAGEVKLAVTDLAIPLTLEAQLRYLEPRIQLHHVVVKLKISEDISVFKTDPYLFKAIITNLIANAVEFSNPHSEVTVTLQKKENDLVIQVQNFGAGITEEEQRHIYERFHQISEGTTKTHQGLGLGLSIVKEFTDVLRGQVRIASNKNETTVISVLLPELSVNLLGEEFGKAENEILFGDFEVL